LNSWDSGVEPMSKVIHHVQIYHFAKFVHFWNSGR
jgi:hypothetical protein